MNSMVVDLKRRVLPQLFVVATFARTWGVRSVSHVLANVTTLSLAALCFWPAASADAAKPGELAEWKVASSDPPVTIRFRYCPAGTIRPGKPAANPADAESLPPLSVRDFYLGETEVTLAQFRAILGDTGLAPLKAQAAKVQATNPQLFEALQKGQLEPAFFVGLDGAVDFCNRLQAELNDIRSQTPQPSLDTRLFRLPSHAEWQYAARAVATAAGQQSVPHFGRWVKLADLSPANQQKCNEVWQSLGHGDSFPGNQESFLELARTTDSAQQEKVKEILIEAFGKAFGSAPRAASGLGTLQPVGKTQANAWNLTDMHEGVSEWTLWAAKIERSRDLWSKLATARQSGKPLTGQEDIFLSGGSFGDSYFGAKSLSRFTVWGGPKLTDDQPQPFAFQSEIVLDTVPGFRVLMERVMSDDWLFVLRKGVFQKRQIATTAAEYLASNRTAVDDLTEAEHPSRVAIEFYTDLVGSGTSGTKRLPASLLKIAQMPSGPSTAGGSAVSKLAAIVNKPNPDKTTGDRPRDSDDGAYFQSLAALVKNSSN